MFSEHPRAYFLTWTCYGERLHGDDRGSVDRAHAVKEAPLLAPDRGYEEGARARMARVSRIASPAMRDVVTRAIEETCAYRGWELVAVNVRTNHVHVVVAAAGQPEPVMTTLKAWATRKLVGAGFVRRGEHVWTRHGSTRYLWDDDALAAAWAYVVHGQDGPFDE